MKNLTMLCFILLCCVQVFAQSGLKSGTKAPDFSGTDNNGKTVALDQLLQKNKAVVLFFYRGQWCPYCNKHIQELQDSLHLLTAKGAYVVGVTPETAGNIDKTIEKTHASFSIIQDKGYQIMKAYDVNYVLDQNTVTQYKNWHVDLEEINGNKDHVLPVPATYIIDNTGKITFVQFDKDYRKRASVADLLHALP
ncbi:peroxiredoxin-like family protein [Chitinophaga sp. GbtcB8]|uniref:peroxiredoxin-like family protein n=1 Tax=Chitinophaga sp. GbtcB8 TaxID=2824753 RepID=UPI001C30F980|nr:peroxiredoxin-like family protein [Chitinophaga sp. GbtcB8]